MSKGTFNCNGKVNMYDWQLNPSSLFSQKEVFNVLNKKKLYSSSTLFIFDREIPGVNVLLDLDHFVKCTDAKLKLLSRYEKLKIFGQHSVTNDETDFFSIRRMICEFLVYLRDYITSIKEEHFSLKDAIENVENNFNDLISTISRFLYRLRYISDSTFLYAISNVGNKSNQPEYHLYHTHLDLRWLIITLMYMKKDFWDGIDNNYEELENTIYMITGDLIYISVKIFASITNTELKIKTPYSCTCIRELWVMLQIFTDELHDKYKSKAFWTYVNSVISQFFPNWSVNHTFRDIYKLPHCKNPELFCIWLMYHLTLLYGYNENGEYFNYPSNRYSEIKDKSNIEQVEKMLKIYVTKGGKDGARDEIDEELCIIIPLVQILYQNWWKPQVKIITFLWDCFHKRLDMPFLLQTRGPWSTSSEKKTPKEILDQVKQRIKNACEINNESSFGLFLHLLGTFLQKYYNRSDTKIWNQIQGRIYSRFSQNKLIEFSECGVYNFISLFLTLAITADTVNVCAAMMNLLPSELEWSDSNDGKKCCLIWKSKLTVLLLYKEHEMSFKDLTEHFTEKANAISCRKDEFSNSMMISFIDVFRIILTESQDFERYEHEFLGGWIDRYMYECSPNRVGVLTTTLLKVFEMCSSLPSYNSMGSTSMLNALWNHVASRVRQMVIHCDLNSNIYENPTKLAVAFTSEACRDPMTCKKYRHSAVSLFNHFTTSPIIKDVRIIRLYLTMILQNEVSIQILKKDLPNFNLICIQAWVKCCILNNEINDETNFLKNYIVHFPEIKEILSTDQEINEFLKSNESFIIFLMIILKKRNAMKIEQQCMNFDNMCRQFFNNIDKWALQLVNEENKDTQLSFWIFRCIGTTILCCSSILYVKNQPNNMLKMLITKVALPPDQQNQSTFTYLTQRIFSMIILGLENLNVKADISLQTLIRELFEKYLPLLVQKESNYEYSFKVSDTLMKCFLEAKSNFVHLILDILVCNFIIVPASNTTHKHCYLVMILLKNLIRNGKVYSIQTIESIITVCGPSIMNCYMRVHDHHPHKKQAIEFLKDLSMNPYYKENFPIREKLKEVVWSALQRYIISNSKICFEFLHVSIKIDTQLYEYLFQQFEQTVLDCEKNKRPNAAVLRYLINSVKRSIELFKSKS